VKPSFILYINAYFVSLVRYIPHSQGKYALPKDRMFIWTKEMGQHADGHGNYQPENDGYILGSVDRGVFVVCSDLFKNNQF
jgi:hypothetical protein